MGGDVVTVTDKHIVAALSFVRLSHSAAGDFPKIKSTFFV